MSIYNTDKGLKLLDFQSLKNEQIIPIFKEQFGEHFNTSHDSTNNLLLNVATQYAYNFYQSLQSSFNARDIRIAEGQELDRMALLFDITRKKDETDNEFRIRIVQEKREKVATNIALNEIKEIDGVDEVVIYDPENFTNSLKDVIEKGTHIFVLYGKDRKALEQVKKVHEIGQKILDLKSSGTKAVYLKETLSLGNTEQRAFLVDAGGFSKTVDFHLAQEKEVEIDIIIQFIDRFYQKVLNDTKGKELQKEIKEKFKGLGRAITIQELSSILSTQLQGIKNISIKINSVADTDYTAKLDQYNIIKTVAIGTSS